MRKVSSKLRQNDALAAKTLKFFRHLAGFEQVHIENQRVFKENQKFFATTLNESENEKLRKWEGGAAREQVNPSSPRASTR